MKAKIYHKEIHYIENEYVIKIDQGIKKSTIELRPSQLIV